MYKNRLMVSHRLIFTFQVYGASDLLKPGKNFIFHDNFVFTLLFQDQL